MSRLICYITVEGDCILCGQEMMGKTRIDCRSCTDREKHEKFIVEYNKVDSEKSKMELFLGDEYIWQE